MEEVEVTVLIEEGDVRDLIRGRGHGKGPCRSREECGPHSSHFVCEGSPRERCRSLFHESTKHFLDGEPDSGGFFLQQAKFSSLDSSASQFFKSPPATESSLSQPPQGRYGRQGAMLRVRGVPSGMVLQKVRQEDLPGAFSPPIGHQPSREFSSLPGKSLFFLEEETTWKGHEAMISSGACRFPPYYVSRPSLHFHSD